MVHCGNFFYKNNHFCTTMDSNKSGSNFYNFSSVTLSDDSYDSSEKYSQIATLKCVCVGNLIRGMLSSSAKPTLCLVEKRRRQMNTNLN